jgi:hypothetical protein
VTRAELRAALDRDLNDSAKDKTVVVGLALMSILLDIRELLEKHYGACSKAAAWPPYHPQS